MRLRRTSFVALRRTPPHLRHTSAAVNTIARRPPAAPCESPAPPRAPARVRARRRAVLAAGVLMACAAAGCSREAAATEVVDLATARAEHEAGRVLLVDIREPAEHATGVAAGAKLLPMSELRKRLAEIPTDPSRPVLLICNTQNRSRATLKALRESGGYGHVRYVDGGMSEWARRGWPMVRPTR